MGWRTARRPEGSRAMEESTFNTGSDGTTTVYRSDVVQGFLRCFMTLCDRVERGGASEEEIRFVSGSVDVALELAPTPRSTRHDKTAPGPVLSTVLARQ